MVINENFLDNLNYQEIGVILSLFSDTKIDNIDTIDEDKSVFDSNKHPYSSIIQYMEELCVEMNRLEDLYKVDINSNWNLNKQIMHVLYDWLHEVSFEEIINKHNIYEGNFIKDCLKIYNLASSLVKIGMLQNKPNLECESRKLMDKLIRDIITIESLYV